MGSRSGVFLVIGVALLFVVIRVASMEQRPTSAQLLLQLMEQIAEGRQIDEVFVYASESDLERATEAAQSFSSRDGYQASIGRDFESDEAIVKIVVLDWTEARISVRVVFNRPNGEESFTGSYRGTSGFEFDEYELAERGPF